MKKGVFALLALLMLSAATTAYAQSDDVWTMAESDQYGKKAGGMLGRGLVNVATCFVDIIVQTVNGTKEGPPFVGTMTGLGGGLGCTALRVTSGALDVLTFWVPDFNGIPVGRSYDDCLDYEEPVSEQPSEPAVNAYEAPAAAPVASSRQHDPMDYVKK